MENIPHTITSKCHEYEGGWMPEPGSPMYRGSLKQVRVLVMSDCHDTTIEWEPEVGSVAHYMASKARKRTSEPKPVKATSSLYFKPTRWTAEERARLNDWRKNGFGVESGQGRRTLGNTSNKIVERG